MVSVCSHLLFTNSINSSSSSSSSLDFIVFIFLLTLIMKTAIVLVLCFAAVLAAPKPQDVEVVSSTNENDGSGNFKNSYALSDGTNREETGEFRAIDAETGIQKVTGVISWTAPDGQVITLRYIADENGFQPVGDHLPKA